MTQEEIKALHEYLQQQQAKRREEKKKAEIEKYGPPKEVEKKTPHYDHPNTMEDSTATVLYIVVMIGGLIFVDWWLLWIMATAIYLKFITRHWWR